MVARHVGGEPEPDRNDVRHSLLEDELARLGEPHGVLRTDPFLVLCVTVRDEADILDAFLAFHLSQGVDFVLVTDHASQDSTRAILDWYAANEAVAYFHQPGPRRFQGKWMTNMARLAAKIGASWVINADGDEFWMPRCGDLQDVFRALPDDVSLLPAFPRDFLPPRSGNGFDCEAQTVWDAGHTETYYTDKLKPKKAHRASEAAVVHGGNHTVTGIENASTFGSILIDILHFPVRSFEQFERKVAVRFVAEDGLEDQRKLGTYPGMHHRKFNERRISGALRSDFDAWLAERAVDGGMSGRRIASDNRLALHMRGLRIAVPESLSKASPASFVQPPKRQDIEPSHLVAREVRIGVSALRMHTRRIRGEVKDLRSEAKEHRRTVKVLRREIRILEQSQHRLVKAANAGWRGRLQAWLASARSSVSGGGEKRND